MQPQRTYATIKIGPRPPRSPRLKIVHHLQC